MDNIKQEIQLAQDTEAMFQGISTAEAAVEARTNSRFFRHLLIPVVALILGIIAGTAIVQHNTAAPSESIPPCSVYALTSTPDLNGARDDACYTQNPDGGFTISTGAGVSTAGY